MSNREHEIHLHWYDASGQLNTVFLTDGYGNPCTFEQLTRIVAGTLREEQKSARPSRMRRFLLQGVERRFECILWSNGCVSINIDPSHYRAHFCSFEEFRSVHGEEITWIDGEQ
jgi:hypothetical protein